MTSSPLVELKAFHGLSIIAASFKTFPAFWDLAELRTSSASVGAA